MSSEQPPTRADLANYSVGARILDSAGILVFFAAVGANVARVGWAPELSVAVAALAGYVGADVFSGLVHWFFDTWLTTRTPILGSMFVRPFREHHVDQEAITRHDFVEVNGSNCLATSPILLAALTLDPDAGVASRVAVTFLVALCLGVFLTNQFHKWAHMPSPPAAIRWLQASRIALHPVHHAVHHASPHDSHYCITTGWLNRPLDRIGFFRSLECVISAGTGAAARAEDGALS